MNPRLHELASSVRDSQGLYTAFAIVAAMEIAARTWTDEDTRKYGHMAREQVSQLGGAA